MEKSRPLWDNHFQFVFACISYAVGLGNVWRFPYLCQMHGGGGFLIPYLIMLVVEGMPLLFLELAVGQLMHQGSIGTWNAISPYLCGVGIASVVVSFFLSMYYNVINGWAFWYLFHSFQDPLPWASCPLNINHTNYEEECEKATPTQYFWYRKTLNISPSIEESGSIQWEQAACLILAWLVVYLCILRGTEYTGKVVYVTAILPYIVLIIYLIRVLTLHGATNGLRYMFTPKLEQLANPKTWINAATQIFFSLGLGFGSLIAFASYNDPNNNCERHAIIVSLINSATSIFASIVTFSIYGFKATFNYKSCVNKMILLLTNVFDLKEGLLTTENLENMKQYLASVYPRKYAEVLPQIRNCSLETELDTAVQGTGLAFIVYSEAIKNMEFSQLYSVLYFVMLLLLGIGSMLGNTAAILTPLTDIKFLSSHVPREIISGSVCIINCVIGLIFTTRAGNYWFNIFNDYAATLSLLLIVLVETIAVCYIYGLKRTGISQYQAWDATEGQLVTKDYPRGGLAVIGLLVASTSSCIPLGALVTFIKLRRNRQ
ncbi:sodium- and chloride-dependent transporter XTRP3-like isoform X2 [Pantherophis guttatus]|uniref:Transporter n=1 Tax=Pantherophis guttatus TaxID=94885 RepID=A0A6P9ATY7_PANGU|nr:sodium- and chloride-dependent transporter XTRP3 isoform X2 [Pantherophis guttatus]XP_060541909.1 sodium- and chloride-dependent transporter XTRP3-like isoform X2 [Pantherophis guttatus]